MQARDDGGEEERGRRAAEACLIPWTLANDLMPLFSSPTVSAIALTTSLPTPDRNAVPAMKRRSELVTLPPVTNPP